MNTHTSLAAGNKTRRFAFASAAALGRFLSPLASPSCHAEDVFMETAATPADDTTVVTASGPATPTVVSVAPATAAEKRDVVIDAPTMRYFVVDDTEAGAQKIDSQAIDKMIRSLKLQKGKAGEPPIICIPAIRANSATAITIDPKTLSKMFLRANGAKIDGSGKDGVQYYIVSPDGAKGKLKGERRLFIYTSPAERATRGKNGDVIITAPSATRDKNGVAVLAAPLEMRMEEAKPVK